MWSTTLRYFCELQLAPRSYGNAPLASLTPRITGVCLAGSWFTFFEVIGYMAVLTNLGVVIFTTQEPFFGIDTVYERLVVFVVIEVRCHSAPGWPFWPFTSVLFFPRCLPHRRLSL